jgi:predicted secreted hydrolase
MTTPTTPTTRLAPRLAALLVIAVLAVGGCGGAPILANPPAQAPVIVTPTQPPAAVVDPLPVELPRDDAPHDRLTEWWYYTGHLRDEAGGRWGFEYVIFRAERGGFPVSWASHLALTDETGDRFLYAQRAEIGPQADRAPDEVDAFALAVSGFDPTREDATVGEPWAMGGSNGTDRLQATAAVDEVAGSGDLTAFGLDLLVRATKPAALHDVDGWIDFGSAGSSYYYSRTAMDATGSIEVDGDRLSVEGTAWFDHQWGDFIAVGGGGWDWFAINLDDGTDLTLSLVRDADGSYPLVYGTLVDAAGGTRHLDAGAFSVDVTATWTSPRTGAEYPAGWRIAVPGEDLTIELAPTVDDQELDTRATTGVVYWEGSQRVDATRDGATLGGEAYVELTGYAEVLAAAP